jgi:hypothetical protein
MYGLFEEFSRERLTRNTVFSMDAFLNRNCVQLLLHAKGNMMIANYDKNKKSYI